MTQNLPQPAEPFTFRAAAKACQPAMGVEHRLLDQVRGIDFGLQPAPDFSPGDNRQIVSARCEKPVAGCGIAVASLLEELRHR